MPSSWSRALSRATATTLASVLTLTGGLLSAVPADAVSAAEGSLSGTVTDAWGGPVENVLVHAYAYDVPGYEGFSWGVSTAADGTYAIDALPEGSYQVEFTTGSASPSVVGEWWDDAASQDEAAVVAVTAEQMTSGISAQLASGAQISGTVVDEQGEPVQDVEVRANRYMSDDYWAYENSTYTGADGTYSLGGLRAGEFKLEFATEAASAEVAGEWWDDALLESSATAVTLAAGEVVAGINPVLSTAGSVSGTVTGSDGSPLEGVGVIARTFDEKLNYWAARAYAVTDEDGQYTVAKLRPGSYRLEFSSGWSGPAVLTEWWQDASSPELATDVVVAAGETTSGISPQLALAGTIVGQVTDESGGPVEGVGVTVWTHDVPGYEGQAWSFDTAEDGTYSIGGLPAGQYKVEFTTGWAAVNVLGEWWDDAADEDSAEIVTVDAGATTEGISAALATGGSISGTVTDASGSPVPGLSVYASKVGTTAGFEVWAQTDEEGRYVAEGLPSGQYLVRFEGSDDVLAEWWDDARTKGAATPVTVVSGSEVAGISPQLAPAGAVAGVVTDENGEPVSGVEVRVTPVGSHPFEVGERSGVTGSDGSFVVRGLSAGDHTVQFVTADASASVIGEWWDDAPTKSSSTLIAVHEGSTTPDISPQLSAGGQISGMVVDGDGAPFQSYTVQAYFEDEAVSARTYASAEDDGYTIRGLRPGSYTLRFTGHDPSGDALVEWWENAENRGSATAIPVTAGTPVPGIDVMLSEDDGSILDTRGASLSGTVTDANGVPVPNADVAIMDAGGRFGDGTSTDASGDWWFGAVASDDFKVAFRATLGGEVVTEYWDDASDFDSAEVIALAPGEQRTGISAVLNGTLAPALESAEPTITGVARSGGILTAVPGAWTDGTTFTYRWLADGDPIADAMGASLLLDASNIGKSISVVVTGSLAGYESVSRTSPKTAAIEPAALTTAVPTISGKLSVGSTVTAKPGAWTPGTAFTYQWFASGEAIADATAATFTITPTQLGKKLTVRVSGSLTNYASSTVTSAASAAVAAGTLATTAPVISGTAAYGFTLTAKPGVWTSGTSFSYQWYANGVAISGARSSTLKLGSYQKGKNITVKVGGKKTGYVTATRTSAATGKVSTTSAPSISGTRMVGATLSAVRGTWTTGTSFSYQWYVDGKAISGATGSTYRLSSGTETKRITVKVTGRKAGYVTVSRTSSATSRIMRASTPTIAGTRMVGSTLTVQRGTWTAGTSFKYQWYVSGVAVSGATGSTFYLNKSRAGKTIKVRVTGVQSGYQTIARASGSTSTVRSGKAAPATRDNCPSGYPVKGNQTTQHTTDWIYHVPGGRYYAVTDPEECFATTSAARAWGYRASMQ